MYARRFDHITSISRSKLMCARILRRHSIVRSCSLFRQNAFYSPIICVFWKAQIFSKSRLCREVLSKLIRSSNHGSVTRVQRIHFLASNHLYSELHADQFLSLLSERSYECFIVVRVTAAALLLLLLLLPWCVRILDFHSYPRWG